MNDLILPRSPRVLPRRYFRMTNTSANHGTFWPIWGGWITADHVHTGAAHLAPPFAGGDIMRSPDIIDVCMYGTKKPLRPRDIQPGERLEVFGFPGGSEFLSVRFGKVHAKRTSGGSPGYSQPTWIGHIDDRPAPYGPDQEIGSMYEPVVGGMSGGLVQAPDGEALGVLVTQNGLADLDGDGDSDNSFDFVALADVYDVFFGEALTS